MVKNFSKVEYVWIDADGNTRSKCRTIKNENHRELFVNDLLIWNYDGSSTGQAIGSDSEVYIRPVKLYPDPFRGDGNYIALCDTWMSDMKTPHVTNYRFNSDLTLRKVANKRPWFGFEMEFFMMDINTNLPLGFPMSGETPEQGRFYCSAGGGRAYGREIIERHYEYCLRAGINVTGINAEVACGQWEYQVMGEGIDVADDAWMTRYILARVCEEFNVYPDWDPKPIEGDCNGSGMHTNYSTIQMREAGGLKYILEAIEKLELKHKEHIDVYGAGNHKRLTGEHETAHIDKFSWGYGDRGASVRVGNETKLKKCGYLEDRRVASSCDMYQVVERMIKTTLL